MVVRNTWGMTVRNDMLRSRISLKSPLRSSQRVLSTTAYCPLISAGTMPSRFGPHRDAGIEWEPAQEVPSTIIWEEKVPLIHDPDPSSDGKRSVGRKSQRNRCQAV
jgi:hypothetical protein